MTPETSSISNITRFHPDNRWTFAMTDGNNIVGESSRAPIVLQLAGGKIPVKPENLQRLILQRDPASLARAPRTPGAAPVAPAREPTVPSRKEAACPGVKYRPAAEDPAGRISYAPALLLSTRKHAAVLDPAREEGVFYDLEKGSLSCVKAEARPAHLVEKGGKIYVANQGSNSLTLIGARTPQPRGRVALGLSPHWLAAPARGEVLHIATREEGGVHAFDTKKDKLLGPLPLKHSRSRMIFRSTNFITVSPDNRRLITQSGLGSPSCRPTVFYLDGLHVTPAMEDRLDLHNDHPGPFIPDPSGNRMYWGFRVYSGDIRRLTGQPPCVLTVPHPTLKLVFGVQKGEYSHRTTQSLLLLDEEKLTVLKEIPLGDLILNLVPAGKVLLAVGPRHLYPIDLDRILAEAGIEKISKEVFDLSRETDPAPVRKAEDLVKAGVGDLDARRFDEARRKFEEADRLDPYSGGRAGLAMLMVREEKYGEAIE